MWRATCAACPSFSSAHCNFSEDYKSSFKKLQAFLSADCQAQHQPTHKLPLGFNRLPSLNSDDCPCVFSYLSKKIMHSSVICICIIHRFHTGPQQIREIPETDIYTETDISLHWSYLLECGYSPLFLKEQCCLSLQGWRNYLLYTSYKVISLPHS